MIFFINFIIHKRFTYLSVQLNDFYHYVHRVVQAQSQLILEHFHHVLNYYLLVVSLPHPQPLATTNILSISVDLPSCKWNHAICGLCDGFRVT